MSFISSIICCSRHRTTDLSPQEKQPNRKNDEPEGVRRFRTSQDKIAVLEALYRKAASRNGNAAAAAIQWIETDPSLRKEAAMLCNRRIDKIFGKLDTITVGKIYNVNPVVLMMSDEESSNVTRQIEQILKERKEEICGASKPFTDESDDEKEGICNKTVKDLDNQIRALSSKIDSTPVNNTLLIKSYKDEISRLEVLRNELLFVMKDDEVVPLREEISRLQAEEDTIGQYLEALSQRKCRLGKSVNPDRKTSSELSEKQKEENPSQRTSTGRLNVEEGALQQTETWSGWLCCRSRGERTEMESTPVMHSVEPMTLNLERELDPDDEPTIGDPKGQ